MVPEIVRVPCLRYSAASSILPLSPILSLSSGVRDFRCTHDGPAVQLADTFLPLSPHAGEIDIMEARGNGPTYPKQYVPPCFSRRVLFRRADA